MFTKAKKLSLTLLALGFGMLPSTAFAATERRAFPFGNVQATCTNSGGRSTLRVLVTPNRGGAEVVNIDLLAQFFGDTRVFNLLGRPNPLGPGREILRKVRVNTTLPQVRVTGTIVAVPNSQGTPTVYTIQPTNSLDPLCN